MIDKVTWRPRVVVCGTKFGRVYLSPFRRTDFPFELASVVAKGSDRSRACAQAYDVPLVTDVRELPDGIDIACVVVGAGPNGGPGAALSMALMARGIHVLQEHPVHETELIACLREARRCGVTYHLNTHHVHVAPVRRFVTTCRELFRKQPPLFVDAVCSFQTAYTLLDILGAALGGLRPWAFSAPVAIPPEWRSLTGAERPFRTLEGVIAGVPLTLRVQHEIDPSDPDNYSHLMHRIAIGVEGGVITLISTHGPVVWSSRAHLPADARQTVAIEDSPAPHFNWPSVAALGPAGAPSYREVLTSLWPDAIGRALVGLREAITAREDPSRRAQYHLTLCRLWHDMTTRLGPVTLVRRHAPHILSAGDLREFITADEEILQFA